MNINQKIELKHLQDFNPVFESVWHAESRMNLEDEISLEGHLFRLAVKKYHETIKLISEGYEMDCMISIEFTPAPDYAFATERVIEFLSKYEIKSSTFEQWLRFCHQKQVAFTDCDDSIYLDLLSELKEYETENLSN